MKMHTSTDNLGLVKGFNNGIDKIHQEFLLDEQ